MIFGGLQLRSSQGGGLNTIIQVLVPIYNKSSPCLVIGFITFIFFTVLSDVILKFLPTFLTLILS